MSTWSSQVCSLCDNGRELMHKDGLSSRSRTWNCSFDACLFLKLTWVCFHLKTSGFIFLDSRPKLPKHGRKFSLVFQVINFLTIHVPRPMSHIGQGRHRSWMLGNIFTHSPHNEHRYPGTTPEPRGHRALIPAPMRSMRI